MMVRWSVAISYFPFFFGAALRGALRDAARGLDFFFGSATLAFFAAAAAALAAALTPARGVPADLLAVFVGAFVAFDLVPLDSARARRGASASADSSPANGSSGVPSAPASIRTTSD